MREPLIWEEYLTNLGRKPPVQDRSEDDEDAGGPLKVADGPAKDDQPAEG